MHSDMHVHLLIQFLNEAVAVGQYNKAEGKGFKHQAEKDGHIYFCNPNIKDVSVVKSEINQENTGYVRY